MSEIAEKEFAGEIYLVVSRLNELINRAAREQGMRSVINVERVRQVPDIDISHITVTVYKRIQPEESKQIER
jgi:hypothetical protein